MLPSDPMILLSFVNMRLRDEDLTLDEFCDRYDCDREELVTRLDAVGYHYIPETNMFH